MLNPSEDIKINRFQLDEESANISHLIYLYDQEWHKHSKTVNKLEAQIKNLEDSLKVFRLQQFAKVKQDWEKCGFDKPLTDKPAEAYPYTLPEYAKMFNELKDKREEYADAKTNADLYCNFHYQLLDKSRQLDLLWKMFSAQYFTTDLSGGEKTKNNSNAIGEFAEKMTTRPTRREK